MAADLLATGIEHDIQTYKRHLNPIVRGWEEAVERAGWRGDDDEPAETVLSRMAESYAGLWLRPLDPSAWLDFCAAGAAFQAEALRVMVPGRSEP